MPSRVPRVTPVLGGGWREVVAGAVVGLFVGVVALLARRTARAEPMVSPLAGVVASFSAAAIAQLGLDASPNTVTLAALITFLPGMSLTIGVRELATEHLQSGVANTANALIQLLGLVFGVGVGRSLATQWFGVVQHTVSRPGFSGTHLVAALAAGLAFTVTLRASFKAAPTMCAATLLAVAVSAIGRSLFGPAAGTFAAALAIGLVGGLLAGRLHRPRARLHRSGGADARARKHRVQQPAPAPDRQHGERYRRGLQRLRDGDGDLVRVDGLHRDPAVAPRPLTAERSAGRQTESPG